MARSPGGIVEGISPRGLGRQAGLKPGDRLIAINDHLLRDVIDVQFYGAEEVLDLLSERNGRRRRVQIERAYGEDLGLTFAHPTFDVDIRRCANNCDFCFVKQNAPGLRPSLFIKDDDYRYSFLFGNFVTLTNLTEDDWERLAEQRLSPLCVSVHATDPDLRRRFLARKTAPDVLEQLRRLASLGIEVHAQVVLVPGLNDGEHLVRTVSELSALHRRPIASISIVPIGLTRHHRGRCRTYTPDESRAVLDQVEPWRLANCEDLGDPLVYPSDEWYLVAGRPLPPAVDYFGFPQVENGVGMVRQFLDEWALLRAGVTGQRLRPANLVTGTLFAPVLSKVVQDLHGLTGGLVQVVAVPNEVFGLVTTVAGLLTGQDILSAMRGRDLTELVILPSAMLTLSYGAGSAPPGMTLDDLSVQDLELQLGAEVKTAGTMAEVLEVLSP